ncbi:Chromodomain helicase-DNA-binding protein, putative [Ectocarpus siliculosus]|uniref:Chromodomain helicase-DNA-binding protein, putative n=1 Tax=Ectocarpus siliculosus TaxID=2880 RepID=D7FQ97_ECTSI|nr:Chromodomain helicase-DNA-binding protein, putative [Ectocarpus siliculosus]|eukprot:CBJ48429.1 Chromodomain helicase-DNA-binding protein, putative [Ectocarpus siliculosus]
MDVAASQPPSHHGTAAPTRSSPPKPTTGGAESPRGARGGASGVNGGSGSGSGNASGVSRKRVRVRDEKLGEFAVLLAPYEGDHNDICEICDKGGDLLCCDFCNLVYHLCCVTPKLTELPDEDLWMCPACTAEVTSRQIAKRRRLEDGGRSTSPGPGGSGRHHGQERVRGYQGVKAENDAFRAFVLYKNQTMDIGLFPTAQAAARAYDRKALSLFGDAAVCNFPADEQVEVEGVATDGTTVKGVVRSFHQWRAEMQWGNKKRHLGFFERRELPLR